VTCVDVAEHIFSFLPQVPRSRSATRTLNCFWRACVERAFRAVVFARVGHRYPTTAIGAMAAAARLARAEDVAKGPAAVLLQCLVGRLSDAPRHANVAEQAEHVLVQLARRFAPPGSMDVIRDVRLGQWEAALDALLPAEEAGRVRREVRTKLAETDARVKEEARRQGREQAQEEIRRHIPRAQGVRRYQFFRYEDFRIPNAPPLGPDARDAGRERRRVLRRVVPALRVERAAREEGFRNAPPLGPDARDAGRDRREIERRVIERRLALYMLEMRQRRAELRRLRNEGVGVGFDDDEGVVDLGDEVVDLEDDDELF